MALRMTHRLRLGAFGLSALLAGGCSSRSHGDNGGSAGSGGSADGGGSGGSAGRSAGGSSGRGGVSALMDGGAILPIVEGPITGGRGTELVAEFDLSDVGYVGEEFFVSGTASGYVGAAELASDGRWTVKPSTTANYRTRIVVHRPSDPSAFSGTVVVEWMNVTIGRDWAVDWTYLHTELTRRGHAWVGVTAQLVGVIGNRPPDVTPISLKGADPDRYASLEHPGDTFSYDMFTQVGAALRSPGAVDPLAGLQPKTVIAVGMSQSAMRLVTYVNAIHPITKVYDGYLIHGRGASAQPLSQEPQERIEAPPIVFVRDDLDVPVFTLQTETELLISEGNKVRQPDTSRLRLWEIAGAAHVDTYLRLTGAADPGGNPAIAGLIVSADTCNFPINSGQHHFAAKAAFAGLNDWIRSGKEPPRAPPLEVSGDPPVASLDANGNVQGGVRTPAVEAPVARLSGVGNGSSCALSGVTEPFDSRTLSTLYPDHAAYVTRVTDAANRAVRGGFLIEEDALLIEQAAEASSVPTTTGGRDGG